MVGKPAPAPPREVGCIPSRCHWHGCELLTDRALLVELIPNGSMVARPERRVPLCPFHRTEARTTGRIRLAYHPDNTRPVNAADQPYEDSPDDPIDEADDARKT